MYVKKDKANSKSIIIMFLIVCAVAVFLGLSVRPLVSKAASSEDATLTDARDRLPGFQSSAFVATPSDVDRSPYLTNEVFELVAFVDEDVVDADESEVCDVVGFAVELCLQFLYFYF